MEAERKEVQAQWYNYSIPTLKDAPISWTSQTPPEESRDNMIRMLAYLGVDNDHLRHFSMYVQTDGNMWQPLVGQGPPESVLFPVAIQTQDDIEFLEPEYLRLGEEIVNAYIAMQMKRVELSRGLVSEKKKEFLREVERKIRLVDRAIAGTGDLAKVFDLWARKRFSKKKCALAMYMSERTWARRTRDVKVYLAKELTRNVPPTELQSLLAEAQTAS